MPTIADIMTKDVLTVRMDTPIKELARLFAENDINGAPVVDDEGVVVGVVCESDLLSQNKPLHIPTVFVLLDSVIPFENPWRAQKDYKRLMATTVGDICSKPAFSIYPEMDLTEAAGIMSERQYYTLPVVVGSKLVGIVGKSDLIKAIAAMA